ncbi:MAG: alanine racemase [Candidatus Delongbacteria bacterium]|nr:alanine racemase [Candidatus Delongbacteria bacterium]
MRLLPTTLANRGLDRPRLLLDEHQARRNIAFMAEKAAAAGVRFRPHFKTHQSAIIGNWFRDQGITALTVSSLEMAAWFAQQGWLDITVAFPLNLRQLALVEQLSGKLQLGLLVDCSHTVSQLSTLTAADIRVWIEIDTGYQRSGILVERVDQVKRLLHQITNSPRLRFAGLLTHSGQTYHADSSSSVVERYNHTVRQLKACRQELGLTAAGCPLSVGDTPGCTLAPDLKDVEEIRPGNFVFYDLMQERLGVCRVEEIALVVACPVVAVYPEQQRLVIYGGAAHFGRESLRGIDGEPVFGYVGLTDANGTLHLNRQTPLVTLSQEHGLINDLDGSLVNSVKPGDLLLLFPVHACLTADLYPVYHTLTGETVRRRRSNDSAVQTNICEEESI